LKRIIGVLVLSLVLGFAEPASATPTGLLEITSGSFSSGLLATNGADYFFTDFNGWNLRIGGQSALAPGTIGFPNGLLVSAQFSCNGGGCLTDDLVIKVSDIDWTLLRSPGSLSLLFDGNLSTGSSSLSAYSDTSNAYFGTGALLTTLGVFPPSGHPRAANLGGSLGPSPYSLTLIQTVRGGSSGHTAGILLVTEPSSIALLGIGLSGMLLLSRRFRPCSKQG
jgi:hypothetical protein